MYADAQGACVHSTHTARTTRTHRACDREKLGVFATTGNILSYAAHTTTPTCACLADHHFAVYVMLVAVSMECYIAM